MTIDFMLSKVVLKSPPKILCEEVILAQRRKDAKKRRKEPGSKNAKKTLRNAAALGVFAPLREKTACVVRALQAPVSSVPGTVLRMEIEDFVHHLPFTVDLQKGEKIRESMAAPVVELNTRGCR